MCLIVTSLLISSNSSITGFAAGKTAAAYKNNTYSGTSDASSFLSGIRSKDSQYTTTYKESTSVVKTDFYDKSKTIKYWASHGSNYGTLRGDANYISINIFDTPPSGYGSSFSWAGGNLEFVFLAACNQLDGLGLNPRAKYANAMIGNSAVRVIAGYHESAPANGIDKKVADKFIEYAKTGESVKSSWLLANKYFSDNGGYSTYDHCCVLTHSGNVQYSRFEGFSSTTYTRPNSSSTTILRFSKANPNGVNQPLSASSQTVHGLTFRSNISINKNLAIPNYSLIETKINAQVNADAKVMVLRDDGDLSTISGEIGHTPVKLTVEEAKNKSMEWLNTTFEGIDSQKITNASVEVEPIVMAEVNLEGGPEVEQIVAYSVKYNNTFDGIPILGNYYSTIVDDNGIVNSSLKWSDFKKVRSNVKAINYMEAAKKVSDKIAQKSKTNKASITEASLNVNNFSLVFDYDPKTNSYQPTWLFRMDDGEIYKVNCFNGDIR